MNLANQPTVAKAVVNGTEYRQVRGEAGCIGCVADGNEGLCERLPLCITPATDNYNLDFIWLKIA